MFRIRYQDAKTLMRPAPDAPAQLVQLRQSEMFRVLNQHHRRIRTSTPTSISDVATSAWILFARKSAMTDSLSAGLIRPCSRPALNGVSAFARSQLLGDRLDVLVRVGHLHARINDVCLSSAGHLFADELKDFGQLDRGAHKGFDRAAPPGSSSITETSRSP